MMTFGNENENYEFSCVIGEDRYIFKTLNDDIIHSIYETTDLVNALREKNIMFVRNESAIEISIAYSLRDIMRAIREELCNVKFVVY